jgi:hypothetical protein
MNSFESTADFETLVTQHPFVASLAPVMCRLLEQISEILPSAWKAHTISIQAAS